MQSRLLGLFIFTKEEAESLKKLRIIKQNLIHVQGLPKKFANIEKLKSKEYFGQYGTIKNIILSKKINPENNKEAYSVYITYENKIEAASAILCIDSLLIDGKIIRAFFGTTKYCNSFLNNQKCKNCQKCVFLHQLVTNKDIIIDENTKFSYSEHLNMSKKIIEQSNLDKKKIFLKKRKNSKFAFPSINFMFLSEEQKEKYFGPGNISYIKSNDAPVINLSLKNNFNLINTHNKDNIISQKNGFNISCKINTSNIVDVKNIKHFNPKHCINVKKYQDPFELYNIFKDSIKHILLSKPFFCKIRNAPLKKMEYNYFKNDLLNKGVDINLVLGGCLDCMNDCI